MINMDLKCTLEELKAFVAQTNQPGEWFGNRFIAKYGVTLEHSKDFVSFGGQGAAARELRAAIEVEVAREAEFYWEWLKHSDHLFGVRSGLFLLGETILLSVVVPMARTSSVWTAGSLFAVGVFLSVSWLYYSVVYSCFSRNYIVKRTRKFERRWRAYRDKKDGGTFTKVSGYIVGYVPPLVVTIFWVLAWIAVLGGNSSSPAAKWRFEGGGVKVEVEIESSLTTKP